MEGNDNTAYFHGLVNKRKASNVIPDLMVENNSLVRPNLECSFEKKLSEEEANGLIGEFSKEEIKTAIFECGSERAPGPDGGCTSSFITLLPKIKEPGGFGDYHLINLTSILNKVVSKVLSNRLKKVTGSVNSVNRTAFIKDRLFLDGTLILNEVILWVKKRGSNAFLFKIDFGKAYNNVN
ncbi:uncharacterized protein LOC110876979 [Helianthus annuus]|uniref:uncharacterized protein LOC110876979 n=1 Tax=Helianthus annuus TaxID=4232 RepID=UPI000B8FFE52|nr:uncharacterized protein LOC110876979 [Helianthus annuus]